MAEAVSHFPLKFKDKYQRNRNSRSKTKNLRCFPSCCSPHSHVTNGFCGQSVSITLAKSDLPSFTSLVAYAKFAIQNIGDYNLPKKALHKDEIRSEKNLCSEWIRVGIVLCQDGMYKFTINPDLLGWHYGWTSNRNKSSILHCLRLFIFDEKKDKTLQLLKQVSSSGFIMYSGTRKTEVKTGAPKRGTKRNTDEASAQLAGVVTKRKIVPKSPVDPKLTVKEVLRRAFSWFKADHGRKIERIYPRIKLPEEAAVVKESISLVEEFLCDSDWFMQVNVKELQLNSEDDNNNCPLIKQVLSTISGSTLADEMEAYMRKCATGPMGRSICQSLIKLGVKDAKNNQLVRDFSASLFKEFLGRFIWRFEEDLYQNGLIVTRICTKQVPKSSPQIEEEDSTAIVDLKEDFPITDVKAPFRLLKLIAELNGERDIIAVICQENKMNPSNPYKIVNKMWIQEQDDTKFGEDILYKQFGVFPLPIAKLELEKRKRTVWYATNGLVIMKGKNVLSPSRTIQLIADGKEYLLRKNKGFYHFFDVAQFTYRCVHKITEDGSYISRAIFRSAAESALGTGFCMRSSVTISASEPDILKANRHAWLQKGNLTEETAKSLLEEEHPQALAGLQNYPIRSIAEPFE